MMAHYLGVDVGSVSTNIVVIDEDANLEESIYIRTQGQPIKLVQECIRMLSFKKRRNGI